MFRTLFLAVTILTLLSAVPTRAAQPPKPRTATFEPCNYWAYDFQTSHYTCRNTSFRISVYTAQETKQIIEAQDRKIQDLEKRLAALEQKLP